MGQEVPIPPWRTPPKPTPTGQPLSQQRIVDTALRILKAEGLDAVSMRRIAQELGTGPASLYAHVSDKQELQQLMLDQVAGEIEIPEPDPDHWQEQIRNYALDAQRISIRYADIAKVSLTEIWTGPHQLGIAEKLLAILRAGGVSERAAAWTLDQLTLLIDAHAIQARAFQTRASEGVDPDAYAGQVMEFFESLPPERFPHLTAMAAEVSSSDLDGRFAFGLDVFIQGLSAYVEK